VHINLRKEVFYWQKGGDIYGKSKQKTLQDILGKVKVEALYGAGVTNLKVEQDGSISGTRDGNNGMPTVQYLKNITIKMENGLPEIRYDLDHSVENIGAVI
jgi:hypothetical protein